jgi:hypothetical protein
MPRTAGAASAGAKRPSSRRDSGEGLSGPHCSHFCSFLNGRRAWIPVFRSLLSIIPSGSASPYNGKYILLAGRSNSAGLLCREGIHSEFRSIESAMFSCQPSGPISNPRHVIGDHRFFRIPLHPGATSDGAKRHILRERPRSPAPDSWRDECRERSDQALGVPAGRCSVDRIVRILSF